MGREESAERGSRASDASARHTPLSLASGESARATAVVKMSPAAGVKTHQHKHSLKRRFEVLETLGNGTYGKVKKAVEKRSGKPVAIKSIRKERVSDDLDRAHIKREIEIISSLSHSNIIQIYEVFESREKIVMVMEYASGGELYEYIQKKGRLTEEEARHFFSQITSAVLYCHKNGVVHRDLKLENVLLDQDLNVKLADFGLSNQYQRGHFLETFCGSPLYASPEIINALPYQGPEVDCWALGVLLYALVYGFMPFDGCNYNSLREQISQGRYRMPNTHSDAYTLIGWMLTVNVEERATVEDVANHWWLNPTCTVTVNDCGHNGFTPSDLSTLHAHICHSFPPVVVGDRTRGSTVPRKSHKERQSIQHLDSTNYHQSTLPSLHLTCSSHSQLAKLPKKGILKKFRKWAEYTSSLEHSDTGQKDTGGSQVICQDKESGSKGTDNDRKRKGILKRNSISSSLVLSSNTMPNHEPAPTWSNDNISDNSYTSNHYKGEDLEIEITLWET
ncbi:hypothetical protein MHYP_G00081810 [Metynnis hypsauchen]